MDDCLKYEQLADILQIEASTMRNVWREYPHFFITEASRKSGNLKGARFSKDDVLRHLKEKAEHEDGNTRNPQGKRHGVPSLLQVSGAPVLKDLLQPKRGKGMGASRKSGPKSAASYATEFDVFPC